MLLAAKVWHYWVSFGLIAIVLLSILGTLLGYLVKVVSLRYPKR